MVDLIHSTLFKLIFGIIGNVIGVGVNLAPMPVFLNIYRKKSTQGFSGLPYVFSLVAAMLWVLYGLPIITPDAVLLLTINSASSAIQIFYLTVFFTYAAGGPLRHVLKALVACLLALALVAILVLTIVPRHLQALTVGSLCVVIGIMTYASPLSVARRVIIDRSVEFLPIHLCIFLFINSTIWTCYGIITRDKFVLIPNGFGVVFGASQLLLYVIYRNATPRTVPKQMESPEIIKSPYEEDRSVRPSRPPNGSRQPPHFPAHSELTGHRQSPRLSSQDHTHRQSPSRFLERGQHQSPSLPSFENGYHQSPPYPGSDTFSPIKVPGSTVSV